MVSGVRRVRGAAGEVLGVWGGGSEGDLGGCQEFGGLVGLGDGCGGDRAGDWRVVELGVRGLGAWRSSEELTGVA